MAGLCLFYVDGNGERQTDRRSEPWCRLTHGLANTCGRPPYGSPCLSCPVPLLASSKWPNGNLPRWPWRASSRSTRHEWAKEINLAWFKSVDDVCDVAELCAQAHAQLGQPEYNKMCAEDLKFSARLAGQFKELGLRSDIISYGRARALPANYSSIFSFKRAGRLALALPKRSVAKSCILRHRLWELEDIAKLIDDAMPKPDPRGLYKRRSAN